MIPFHETASMGTIFRANRWTVLAKPLVAVSNFANSPENCLKLSRDFQYYVIKTTKIFVDMLLNSLGYYFSCGRTRRVRFRVYWFVRNVFASPSVVAFIETKNTGNVVLNFLRRLVWNSFLLRVSVMNIPCLALYFIFMNNNLFFFCAQCHMFWSLRDTCELDFLTRTERAAILLPENVSRHDR
jgi:hypothetical protein